jgi:molybdopterin converting factor small subunit
MSQDKCPRCGHGYSPSNVGLRCEVIHWGCGTYREPSGNIYESELCETRQEKRIACEQLEALSEDFGEMQERAEKAEAKNIYLLTAVVDVSEKAEEKVHDLKKQMLGMWNYQTRAEKAEAELAKANKLIKLTNVCELTGSATWEDLNGAFAVGELKQLLAKREKALEQAVRHISCFCAPMAEEHTATALAHDLIRRCADESPELAEWLKQRGEK